MGPVCGLCREMGTKSRKAETLPRGDQLTKKESKGIK